MTPKVYVPYVDLHPTTRQVVDGLDLDVTYVRLTDDDGYRRLLQRLWQIGETVILIEQDIVPWPGAAEELYSCMGLWCACAYKLFGGYGIFHGFGLTKLSAELMRQLPSVWDTPGHWSTLDQRLFFAARAISQEPHPHRPAVVHLGAHTERCVTA